MDYKTEKKEGFKVVGLSIDTNVKDAPTDCPKVWEKFMLRHGEIKNSKGKMKNYGVCFKMKEDVSEFKYIACCEVSGFDDVPTEMVMADIEESKYLVFTHKGKLKRLGKTYDEIMDLIKKEGFKQKNFWVEFYDSRWKGDNEDSEMEIWCAVE